MITRGAPIGTVCFRCQLRLLRQSTSVRRFASDATTAAASAGREDDAQRDITRQDAAQKETAQQDIAQKNIPQQDTTQQDITLTLEDITRQDSAQDGQSPKKSGKLGPAFRNIYLRRRHVSRNRILEEVSTKLGTTILGKPAYAIVMKDGGIIKKEEHPLDPIGDDEDKVEAFSTGADDIATLLDHQREPPTQIEARINIQSLRPLGDKALPEKEFREIQRLLTGGFLKAQLQDYIKWHKHNPNADARPDPENDADTDAEEITADTPAEPDFAWIQERTLWAPLQSQPSVLEGTPLQGYVTDIAAPKDKLAVYLMRECWGLSIVELDSQLGETLVKLRQHEFVLLMRKFSTAYPSLAPAVYGSTLT